ncbi:type IV pilus assembly protein PilM [Candidatus Nomurabacteria bacterium]|nr:type IV pilus assembly protein PilM [Candidatus Nomurabacteria bacterium]
MSNFLTKLISGFSMNKGGSGDSAIGVDIGSSAIKVVEIRRKGGKAVLETYGAIALGPYGDAEAGSVTNLPVEKIALALKEVLKQSGVTSTSLSMSIPIQSSLIFSIELPAQLGESQIASIVPTEARKYIPVPIDEVSIDYFILPKKESSFTEANNSLSNEDLSKNDGEKMNVLVVATQNDAVAKYRSIVSEGGLTSSFFEIEIFSSIRSNFEHELSPVLLMDFGASRTKLSIVEFGMIKSYHTIDRGGADITNSISKSLSIPFSEAEKMKKEFGFFGSPTEKSLADIVKVHIDYIFSETNSVLLGYEKKYDRTVSKIIFTGGGALLKGLKEVAINNFKAEVEMGHPFSKVEAPAFLDKVLETMGPEFAVALGLAMRKLQ